MGPDSQSRLIQRITQLKKALFENGGLASSSAYFSTLPKRHEQNVERFIAIAQVAFALLIVIAYGASDVGIWQDGTFVAIAISLGILVASSVMRISIASRPSLPDLTLDGPTFIDFTAVLAIVATCQISGPASTSEFRVEHLVLAAIVMIGLRSLRAHPRPVFVSGLAALSASIVIINTVPSIAFGGVAGTGMASGSNHTLLALTALGAYVGVMTYAAWHIRQSLWHLNATLENMPHGVALFDREHRLVVSNTQYSGLYGLSDHHRTPGTKITELIRYRYENNCFGDVDYKEHSDDWVHGFVGAESETQELANGRVYNIRRQREMDGRIVTTTEDVTEHRRLEARIEHLAYHDALTGLANRTQMHQRLENSLQQNRADDGLTLFCMDLDQFKEINDSLGHHVGDALLRAVADRLLACVRDGDLVARIGGDEFVILLNGKTCEVHAATMAQRMIDSLTKPFDLKGHQVLTSVSIGIAFRDDLDCNDETLMKKADLALYRAKESGRGTYCFYDEFMSKRLQKRRAIERDLRTALRRDEFEMHYQPIMSADRMVIESVEALIRWHHPEKGMISPGDFIPVADEIGLAVPLGNWVIQQACKDAATLPDHIKVSVNVSAEQFYKPGLAQTVENALKSSGLAAKRLELEITETALLENSRMTISTLRDLHRLGVQIALDDFGTGYSSLSYLQKFSFDRIKIDRSFVMNAAIDAPSSEIIRTVIDLGQRLGMAVTAEGVETREQLDRVTSDGCTAIQGFLISRPLPLSDVKPFLHADAIQDVMPQENIPVRRVSGSRR